MRLTHSKLLLLRAASNGFMRFRCSRISTYAALRFSKTIAFAGALAQFTICLFAFIFISSSANAEEFVAKYDASWSGITIGEMNLRVKEDAQNYEYHVGLNSLGLLKQFTQYKSTNISKGTFSGAEVIPTSYYTYWQRKKEKQQIDIAYTNNGRTVRETANPPEKRWKRPEVEPKDKDYTFDPVTTALVLRKKVREIIESGQGLPAKVTMPVFDARRRFDVELVVNGFKKVTYKGKEQEMLEISFFRTPLVGWNDKELARYKQQDPKITFYLNADYMPAFGSGEAPFGKAVFELVSYCKPIEIACK